MDRAATSERPLSRPQEGSADARVVPGRFSPGFRKVFAWYTRRLVARRFFAVRLAPGTSAALEQCAASPDLVVLALNHSSWWDPLVGYLLQDDFMSGRTPCSPMDATQLAKFGFFRRLGMFGVRPDDPSSLRGMAEYVSQQRRTVPQPLLMITPQGRFEDHRRPIEVRPGVGLVCSQSPGVRVVCGAVEYVFWNEQRPEILLRAVEVPVPSEPRSARAWTEAIEAAMNDNARSLARLAMARDPRAFETLSGGGRAQIHPLYDAFLRLTGRSTGIDTAHRARPSQREPGA